MVERSMSEQIRDVLGAGEVGETRAREAAAAAPEVVTDRGVARHTAVVSWCGGGGAVGRSLWRATPW